MEALLQQSVRNTFNDLTGLLSGLDQEQIDRLPTQGWSAGQVTEHIIKASSGMSGLFNGPCEPARRQPDEQVQPLRELFLNRDIKMQSPDFILPTDKDHPKERIIASLKDISLELDGLAGSMDLDWVCSQPEFPGFGQLTRREWLNFVLFHTQRHTEQIRDIVQQPA
ncbi:DinB family protein [Taibaiella koreensis]|uniref:DinB family protein n=1 Tax=Taibaiella koreensis TaxID=1268548 RepID=UPI000E5991C3|nr:DinB family protein [Taibaiella koreensis]